MSAYPPGTPGPRTVELEFECVNEDCPLRSTLLGRGVVWTAEAVDDLGACWLKDEDNGDKCPECGQEGRQT